MLCCVLRYITLLYSEPNHIYLLKSKKMLQNIKSMIILYGIFVRIFALDMKKIKVEDNIMVLLKEFDMCDHGNILRVILGSTVEVLYSITFCFWMNLLKKSPK